MPPLPDTLHHLKRAAQRLMGKPKRLFTKYAATEYYDLFVAKRSQTHVGALPLGNKVAIFLIFPKAGVQPSHLLSLRTIAQAGFAPLVVSNLALTAADRALILPHCWHLIVRPNFGYDFGGYRDGFLSLKAQLAGLTHVALLNDSCWFPLQPTQNWLMQAEELGADFAAASYHRAMAPVKSADFRQVQWQFDPTLPGFHYGSFAVLLGGKLLHAPAFQRFWQRLRLTNDKNQTVKYGEAGLSRFVVTQGYRHACTCDLLSIPAILDHLGDDRLRQVLRNLILPFDPDLRALQRDLQTPDRANWRSDVQALILTGAVQTGAAYALADLMTQELALPFLKKAPLLIEPAASAALIDIASRLTGDIGEMIRAEIRETLRHRKGITLLHDTDTD